MMEKYPEFSVQLLPIIQLQITKLCFIYIFLRFYFQICIVNSYVDRHNISMTLSILQQFQRLISQQLSTIYNQHSQIFEQIILYILYIITMPPHYKYVEDQRQIKINRLYQKLANTPIKRSEDINQIAKTVADNDILYLVANFQIICKILRPLLLTWKRRPVQCRLNQAILNVFQGIGQKIHFIHDKIQVILPEYNPFCRFGSKIVGKTLGQISSQRKGENDFETHGHLIAFVNYCEKKAIQKPLLKKQSGIIKDKILNMVELRIKQHFQTLNAIKSDKQPSQNPASQKFINDYFQKTANQEIIQVNRQCFGCARFFYSKSQFSYDAMLSFFDVDTIKLQEASKLVESQSNIKALICSFLNTQKGGLILIGCDRIGTRIEMTGVQLTEKQKEGVQQRIEKYIEIIKPPIKRNNQLLIDFIPIFRNPAESSIQAHIQGMYIIRVKIIPDQFTKMYYYELKGDNIFVEYRKSNVELTLQASNYYNFIQEKFKKNYWCSPQNSEYTYKKKAKIPSSHYNILCCPPERIEQFVDEDRQKIKNQQRLQATKNYKYKQKQNEQIIEEENKTQISMDLSTNVNNQIKDLNEEKSKFISLLVADVQTKQIFRKACDSDEKTKGMVELKKFEYNKQEKDLALIKKTWGVYHQKVKFEKLKKIIDTNQIKSKDGKTVYLIQTHRYLKIQNYYNIVSQGTWNELSHKIKQNTNGALEKVVPFQQDQKPTKKYQKNHAANNSWILQFDSLQSAIFAYFYLSSKKKDKSANPMKITFKRAANLMKSENVMESEYGSTNIPEANTYQQNINPQLYYDQASGQYYQYNTNNLDYSNQQQQYFTNQYQQQQYTYQYQQQYNNQYQYNNNNQYQQQNYNQGGYSNYYSYDGNYNNNNNTGYYQNSSMQYPQQQQSQYAIAQSQISKKQEQEQQQNQ